MRRRARKDTNHEAVVRELRQLGASVMETHQLGEDHPDLVVGYRGVTALVEIKSGAAHHRTQRLARERLVRQRDYLDAWMGGPAFVATSAEEIFQRLREIRA